MIETKLILKVLLLVCSSMFMFVGCSNDGEKLEWTNSTQVPTFTYNKGWFDPRCTEHENGQASYDAELDRFLATIQLKYTKETADTTGTTGSLLDFRKKGAAFPNLVVTTATEGTSTRTMRVTYNGVSCEVEYKVIVNAGTPKA